MEHSNSARSKRVSTLLFEGSGSREERRHHDSVLASTLRPGILSPDTSLQDDRWLVKSGKPSGLGAEWIEFDFNIPIRPGPELLTDPTHVDDLLTAKLYIVHGIGEGPQSWTTSVPHAKSSLHTLVDLMRWRLMNRLPRMEDISENWFDLFVSQIEGQGRSGLFPFQDMVDDYIEKLRSGAEQLPIGHRKNRLLSNYIAQRIGFGKRVQIPDKYWKVIAEYVEGKSNEITHAGHRRIAEIIATTDDERLLVPGYTEMHYAHVLAPFDRLWALRGYMDHDPIGFQAFYHQRSRSSLAKSLATKPLERTLLAPDEQICVLVDRCCRLVFHCMELHEQAMQVVRHGYAAFPDNSDMGFRERLRQIAERERSLEEGFAPLLASYAEKLGLAREELNLLPTYRWRPKIRGQTKPGLDFRDLLFKLLPTACAVLIAALTARRNTEITRLTDSCISTDENGDKLLCVWIAKTLQDLDSIPVPESVVGAVGVLDWLSEGTRTEREQPWLFQFHDPYQGGGNIPFDLGQNLRVLAEFLKVPKLPDGSEWDWKPHQFRTFFAVTYFWRFDYPSLTALSAFFRHFNPTMTKAYVTRAVQGVLRKLIDAKEASKERKKRDKSLQDEFRAALASAEERQKDFEQCQKAFTTKVAKGVAEGTERLTGRRGEVWSRELNELVERARVQGHLVSKVSAPALTLDMLIERWVGTTRRLDPHPAGHGFCTCGSSEGDLGVAACVEKKLKGNPDLDRKSITGPDYAFADDLTCARCPLNAQREKANARYWADALQVADEASLKGNTERQRQLASARADAIRKHCHRCFESNEEMEDD